jgi:predicted ATP-dependent endonuclease of OLD family
MYLSKITIRNIKCFQDIELDFEEDGEVRLWNVIIGENATGKTTLLRAIAIALMGQKAASVLLPRPVGWVRRPALQGNIEATIVPGIGDSLEITNLSEPVSHRNPIITRYALIEQNQNIDKTYYEGPTIVDRSPQSIRDQIRQIQEHYRYGWFSAGYGSFRRLAELQSRTSKTITFENRESRFYTLFQTEYTLDEGVQWLMTLDNIRRDPHNPNQGACEQLLEDIERVLNDQLLPDDTVVESVNSQGVFFSTPYQKNIQIFELSDGYRAMISIVIDIIKHLAPDYQDMHTKSRDWLKFVSGVILIDEIDAHLHPTWQRQIGIWLKRVFPRMQFIVTTHSPFIPQEADRYGIYVLQRSRTNGKDSPISVQVSHDIPTVEGWRADQILSTLFETESLYKPETDQRVREYARLKVMSNTGNLSQDQTDRLKELQEWADNYLAPPGDTPKEMQEHRELQRRVLELSRLFREERNNDPR